MLEIVCLSSLSLLIATCTDTELNPAISNPIELNIVLNRVYLAQGKPYESDYSREAEIERERRDIWNHGNSDSERDRIYREPERRDGEECIEEARDRIYREPDEYDRRECIDEEDRIYREPERRDGEEDYTREDIDIDRIYRDPNR
jgi:hypothetical protein